MMMDDSDPVKPPLAIDDVRVGKADFCQLFILLSCLPVDLAARRAINSFVIVLLSFK